MKLLTEVADIAEFHKLKLLMESNGILIHVGNEDSARNFGFFHPVGRYAIHVVYEEQFNDALKLMENEDHIVEFPLNIEEIQKDIQLNQLESHNRLFKIIIKVAIGFIILVSCISWILAVLST
jgi:hypothetical protein